MTDEREKPSKKPRKKPAIKPKACDECSDIFQPRSNATKVCDLCRSHDPNRHRTRASKIPEMLISFDNEAAQSGEGNDAVMWGKCLSWGLENGESGTHFWQWGDNVPYAERGPVGVIMKMCQLVGELYELKQPWNDLPAGTKVRLRPISFHWNFDAAILLKDFDADQMEVVRKVQTKIRSVVCRASHAEHEPCDKLHDYDALLDAIAVEKQKQERTGTAPHETETDEDEGIEGVIHAYDRDDINAVLIEGGESDLVAWDKRSKIAVTFTPRRRFYAEIRPNGDWYGGWHGKLDLHDTGSAFVGGLEKAIDDWNPEISTEQRAAIAWGKKARKTGFAGATDQEIAAYSEAECVAHAKMARMLLDTVKEVGNIPMKPKNLFGSGSVAKAALDHWKVPKRGLHENSKSKSILDMENIAQLTYFGGLIHTPLIGRIPVVDMDGNELFVVGQDINSAYPDKFVNVPCMRRRFDKQHEDWIDCGEIITTTRAPHKKYVIGHVLASWDIAITDENGEEISPTSTPPFVVRGKNMGVYHPMKGYNTWVTLVEYRAAKAHFGNRITGHKFVYFKENCSCGNPRPLQHVEKMYVERQTLKAQADAIAEECRKKGIDFTQEFWSLYAKQLTIKLIINSIYGKFAQMRPRPGAYTNLHIASYITGATRAQMRQKIWNIEALNGTIAYVHTDGVYVLGVDTSGNGVEALQAALDMEDEGPELGKWGAEAPNRDMLLWQAGLTNARQKYKKGKWGNGGKVAARGIGTSIWENAAEAMLTEADLGTVDLTEHPKNWPAIYATDRTMIGLRKARAMGKPHLAGTFQNVEKKLTVFSTDVVDDQIVVVPGQRRDYEHAVQVDGIPTLWTVPPIQMVADPAELDDIKQYRSALDKRYRHGDYDTTEGVGK